MTRAEFETALQRWVTQSNAHAKDIRWQALLPLDIEAPTALLATREMDRRYSMYRFTQAQWEKVDNVDKFFGIVALSMIHDIEDLA